MSIKWYIIYPIVAAAALVAYFTTRAFLISTYVEEITLSNLTLNLLLFTMTWGAIGPRLFAAKPFILKWVLVLGGFLIILVILTLTGTHTRLTDLFGGIR